MPFHIQPLDIVAIVIIGLLLFGPKRIPETARSIGKGIREFRDGITGKDEKAPEASAVAVAKKEPEAQATVEKNSTG